VQSLQAGVEGGGGRRVGEFRADHQMRIATGDLNAVGGFRHPRVALMLNLNSHMGERPPEAREPGNPISHISLK
jgi:hypothetical protein